MGGGYKLLLVLTVGLILLPASSRAQFVYTANFEDGTISGYSIASNGSIVPVPGSPFDGGYQPNSLSVDPSGKFLFVAPEGGTTLLVYAVGSDGALTPVSGSPFQLASSPIAVAVHPNGSGADVVGDATVIEDVPLQTGEDERRKTIRAEQGAEVVGCVAQKPVER